MKKISRNDPCPCGSGKKYKQCCMTKDEAAHALEDANKAQNQALASQYMEQGLVFHRNGQLLEAQQSYQQVLALIPGHADAMHLTGVIAHQQGHYALAIERIQQSLQHNASNAYAHNNLGAVLRDARQFDEALHSFMRATALKPDHAEAHNNIANVYKDLGRNNEAIRSYERALAINPSLAEPWNNLALIHQKQKNISVALQCARQAAALQPDSAEIHNALGNIYKDAGQIKEAIASYQRAVELDPHQGNARHFIDVLSGNVSVQAPQAYVAKIFDDYAERFDEHLQQVLEYNIPAVIGRELKSYHAGRDTGWHILDLGCGTGLVAKELAPIAAHMVGVDLSEKMLLKAQARQIYQRLVQSDLINMTRQEANASYHVVTAADVFVYLGQLDEIVTDVARLLPVGGLFVFSVETAEETYDLSGKESEAQKAYSLRTSGRYAHRPSYLQQLASQVGFHCLQQLPQTIRMENHTAIPGYLYIWRKVR
ncbi:tetratricopeptide repeat protein [Undibacterium sp. TJN19]|uniref:tetratricopeptide repeat protein n=1 Tax=Undibacterium sp. TJN19 TaxID=3413055 RepID=UPI003BF112ED